MPAGITDSDSMFSVRQTPWHGLGAVLDTPPATIAEAIYASGLDWRVEREPIAVDRNDAETTNGWSPSRCEPIAGYFATVRQDTRAVLGIVGERYRIVQNHEAFQFVDQLLGSSLHFETAGSLHGGRRVWVLATLPDHVEVGGGFLRLRTGCRARAFGRSPRCGASVRHGGSSGSRRRLSRRSIARAIA